MYLHENGDDFRQLVAGAAEHYGRAASFVVKDYFAVMMLKELLQRNPDLVFKGGTCLSKCYGVIKRFSEDVDIGIEEDHATEGMRKRIKASVQSAAAALGLSIPNISSTRSRRDYNRYELPLPSLAPLDEPDTLIVETAVMTPASPAGRRSLQSFVGEYCAASGFPDAIDEYGLAAFEVRANSLERTFCDKVFALCDYYLAGGIPPRQSRHVYDLRKLSEAIVLDEGLLDLMALVRSQREGGHACLSASSSVCVPDVLREIAATDAYKADYENLTGDLLYEDLPYEQAIGVLGQIASFLDEDGRFQVR